MPQAAYERSLSFKDAVAKPVSKDTEQERHNGDTFSSKKEASVDAVDSIPANFEFTWFDVLITLVSIGTLIFDIITDIAVAVSHYRDGKMWYFGLTVVFIMVPMLTMTAFSLRWYLVDSNKKHAPSFSCKKWVLIAILLVLQLTPLLRYGTILLYAYKAKVEKDAMQRRKYIQWLVYEDTDAAILRLFECFLESAPQIILQLYIMASPQESQDITTVYIQVVSVVMSVLSVAWSLNSQHATLRLSQLKSANMTVMGRITQFLWRLFDIVARILALGLFVSVFPLYFAGIISFRWALMTIWVISMKTEFCNNKWVELMYNAVLGGVFLFCYFNPIVGQTRWRYLIYYIYTFAENTSLMGLWYAYSDPHLWYRLAAMFLHFLSFLLGIFFMVTYYSLFHPNGNLLFKVGRDQIYSEKPSAHTEGRTNVMQNPLNNFAINAHEKDQQKYLQVLAQCHKGDGDVGTPV